MTTKRYNPTLDTTYFIVRGCDLPDSERKTILGAAIDGAKTSGYTHSLHEVLLNGARAGLVLLLPNNNEAIVATYKTNEPTHYESVYGVWTPSFDGIMRAYLQAGRRVPLS